MSHAKSFQPYQLNLSRALRGLCAVDDPHRLGQLGRDERATLKAKLKELGYKSMRARLKLEEELISLPPPPPRK